MAVQGIGFGWSGHQAYEAAGIGQESAIRPESGIGQDKDLSPAEGVQDKNKVKPGYRSTPAECKTCKERKYQDGSDENVSFKAAAHVSPEAAPAAVRGHEGEHVSNAYTKAAQKGGRVIRASVSIHTAICPECGRVYVSGGTTSTAIAYPKEGSSKGQGGRGQEENFNVG